MSDAADSRPAGVPDSWEVPACRACARRMKFARIIRGVSLVLFLVAIAFAYSLLFGSKGLWGLGRWGMWLWTGAFFIVWVIGAIFFPRTIATTEFPDRVEYEFADPEYAREFCKLNAAEWAD